MSSNNVFSPWRLDNINLVCKLKIMIMMHEDLLSIHLLF